MYILFALLFGLLIYVVATVVLRRTGRGAQSALVMSLVSLLVFIALLVVFNVLSRAIGVDLGPFHGVSYSIPQDYTARGTMGTAVLVVYALACLSPIFGLGAALRTR